ncbi:MAG: DUF721 domain-containing protein [Thermodesulfobacteriota bacterium]
MSDKPRKAGQFTHIGDLLPGIVKSMRRETDTELARIRDIWNQVLEPEIAEHAQPAALKNDALLVHVASPTLTQQLRFLTPEIIKQLNRVIGAGRINEIKYKVGKV